MVKTDAITADKIAAPKSKVGDVVRLKSGGPQMVVSHIREPDGNKPLLRCVWFGDGNTLQADDFIEAILT